MSRPVKGTTRLAGIIGHPLEHTLSPAMHNAAYDAMGLDWVYVPLHVAEERDLPRVVSAIRVLPFVGFNVTMPYKQAMTTLCDEVAELALLAGAVNTVQCVDGRLIGYNTDGRGLLESLSTEAGFEPAGRDVVLLGAGGAAGGALVALSLAKPRTVTVVNRDPRRALSLVGRVRDRLNVEIETLPLDESARDAVLRADLVVNATAVGMVSEDPSPVPSSWLRSGQVVADMVYRAEPTRLVLEARDAGATALNGLGMLVCQGATAIDIWHDDADVQAPRDVMRAAAAEELERAR